MNDNEDYMMVPSLSFQFNLSFLSFFRDVENLNRSRKTPMPAITPIASKL